MDNTDWAEAFALAEGNDTAPSLSNPKHPASNLSSRSSHTVQDEGSSCSHNAEEETDRVAPFLPPITRNQQTHYELLGPLLHDFPSCERYTPRSNAVQQDQCANCHRPSGYHRMATKKTDKNPPRHASLLLDHLEHPASQLYVALRNLRCSLRINPEEDPPAFIIKALQDQVHPCSLDLQTVTSQKPSSKRRRYAYNTPFASDTQLLEACGAMANNILPTFPRRGSSSRSKTMVSTIKAIMACDAIYYRLYYFDLTSPDPTVVPHPVQYFGGCDEQKDGISVEHQEYSSVDLKRRVEVRALFGSGTPSEVTHALERLHQLRMNEGHFLFRRLESKQDDNLWRDWQDSCRDFLCHLYSYATVSSTSLEQLRKHLVGHSVVEIGAGTGYLASLIGNVDAFDSHPGTTDNEYHAATPPFMVVQSGGPKNISQQWSALILCYPPVDNDMAYEALRAFLSGCTSASFGARPKFVHIGEFQGLTGTPRFESLLLERLYCIDKFACLSWGSDAAAITLWEVRSQHSPQPPMSLLVPCVRCNNRPAIRRFRLCRPFAYCSMECAKEDSDVRRDVLPACFSCGLIPWPLQTDSSWQILRVAPRPNSSAVLGAHP